MKLSMRKYHFLRNDDYIELMQNSSSTSELQKIFLGQEIMSRFRHSNSLCLGRMLFEGMYFNANQKVQGVNLYSSERDNTLDTTNMKDFSIIVDLPRTKSETDKVPFLF